MDVNEDGRARCSHKGPRLENVEELTARTFHAFGRMMHANRLAMAKMASQSGTHHGEMVALALLSQREGVNQKELVEILHLSPSRVSMIVDSLEKSGAVDRRADENDRRLTRLSITEIGRQREKAQRELLGEYVNRTIGALSEAERKDLERLLLKLGDKTMELVEADPSDKEPREAGAGA